MAIIVDTAVSEAPNTSTPIVPTLSSHQADDYLVIILGQDIGATAFSTASSGWNIVADTRASTSVRGALIWKKATSSSETAPTITGSTERWSAVCHTVRYADLTTFLDATTVASTSSGVSSTVTGITTVNSGSLVLYALISDGSASLTNYYQKPQNMDCRNVGYSPNTHVHVSTGIKQMGGAGASGSVTFYSPTSFNRVGLAIAIRNASGGVLQPDVQPDVNHIRFYGIIGNTGRSESSPFTDAPNTLATAFQGVSVTTTAPTVSVQSFSTRLSNAEVTTNLWVGGTHTITSTDMTGKTFMVALSSAFNSSSALFNTAGLLVAFSDGTNWAAYQLRSKKAGWDANITFSAAVVLENATPYDSSGTINWAAVTRIGFYYHRTGSVSTSVGIDIANAVLIGNCALTGGGSDRPAVFADYNDLMNGWREVEWVKRQGAGQVVAKASVQVGDGGTHTTYFDATAGSIEFPREFSVLTGTTNEWNGTEDGLTLGIKAGASDSILFGSGVAACSVRQKFTVDAASSTSATHDFAQAFVRWKPTFITGLNVNNAIFSRCSTVNFGGADVTDVTVRKTTSTDSATAWDASGATVTDTTIDVTGTSANYHIELGTAVTAITLADVTFTGTPAIDKVHVKATTGTVTITISGITSLIASDVTSDGATVNISGPTINQSVTVNNLVTGTRVQIYDTTNSVELANEVETAGVVSWTDPSPASGDRDIRVRITNVSGTTAYKFIEASIGTTGTLSATAAVTYRANQELDPVYNTNAIDGSTVTGITFTDAATDVVNINLAGGATTWPGIYAAFVYWISTATGIADDIAYINAVDTANYILTSMVIKNTSSPTVPLVITGGYGSDATTGASIDLVDTSGGTLIFAPDHVVVKIVTVGGVNIITGDIADVPTASEIATQILNDAQSTPIHSNLITESLGLETKVNKLVKAEYNKRVWDKDADTVTIYEDDGITEHAIFDVNEDLSRIEPL